MSAAPWLVDPTRLRATLDAIRQSFPQEAMARAVAEDVIVRLQAPVGLGMANECRGDYRAAIEHYKQIADGPEAALAKRRFTIYAPPYISATARLAWACAQTGDFEQAMRYAARATETAVEMASPVSLAVAHQFKAMALASRGDFTRAQGAAETAVHQCETHGVLAWLPGAYAICGYVRNYVAPSADALAQVERGVAAHEAIGVKTYLSWMTRLWGNALLFNGDAEAARSKAEHALRLARQYGERGEEAEVLRALGDIALTRQDLTEAMALYTNAIELAEKLWMRPVIAHCHLGLARLYRRMDKREQAREYLATATTMYREMGMTYWLEKAEAEMRERG